MKIKEIKEKAKVGDIFTIAHDDSVFSYRPSQAVSFDGKKYFTIMEQSRITEISDDAIVTSNNRGFTKHFTSFTDIKNRTWLYFINSEEIEK